MQALVVTIQIKPEHKEAFMKSMLEDAYGSVTNEPGCLRFDVVEDAEDPNRIHLFEVYKDQAAIDAHRQAPHYLKWRETVKDWHAADVIRRSGATVFPPDSAWKKQSAS